MRELTMNEVDFVSGGDVATGGAAMAGAAGIGAAAFGASWGSVGVGIAFAVSPLAVVAMVGLGLFAGYEFLQE